MALGMLGCTRVNGAFEDTEAGTSAAASTGGRTPGATTDPDDSGRPTTGVDGSGSATTATTDAPPPHTTGQTTDEPMTSGVEETGIAETGNVDTGPIGDPSPCCTTFGGAGCPADPAVQECVCAIDAFCCNEEWDAVCIQRVQSGECGHCEGVEPCCMPDEGPGCGDPKVDQECVCSFFDELGVSEPDCCGNAWEPACAVMAGVLCEAACPPPTGSCCEQTGLLGCEDPTVSLCVCLLAPDCCTNGWTKDCAYLATQCDNTLCPDLPGGKGAP